MTDSSGVFVVSSCLPGLALFLAMIAARIIAAIDNPKDVLVVSNRDMAQRAILKFGEHTGANYFGGKWTPGTLTN